MILFYYKFYLNLKYLLFVQLKCNWRSLYSILHFSFFLFIFTLEIDWIFLNVLCYNFVVLEIDYSMVSLLKITIKHYINENLLLEFTSTTWTQFEF